MQIYPDKIDEPVSGASLFSRWGNWQWMISGTLLLIAANLLRSWQTLHQIAFYVEDAQLFARYYGMSMPLTDVTHPHMGQQYMVLLTNFLAWVYAHFDVRMQASFYNWTGFAGGTAAAVIFFYSGVIRSRPVLLLGPLLVGLVGLNHIFYYNTLIYIMYTAVAVLLCLVFFPTPKTKTGTILMGIAFVLLPWAGPYSVLAVPVSILMMISGRKDGKKVWLLALLLLSTLAYFSTITEDSTRLSRLKELWVIRAYLRELLEKIVFMNLLEKVSLWWWVSVILCLGLVFYLLRHDRDFLFHSLVFFAISGGSLAFFFFSIKFPFWHVGTHPCHQFISLYFWIVFLLCTADRLIRSYSLQKTGISIVVGLTLALIVVSNVKDPGKRKEILIPDTRDFLNTVYAFEQLGLEKQNQFVLLKLDNKQHSIFNPILRVGSRKPDALQVDSRDLSPAMGTKFLVQPVPASGEMNVKKEN